MENRVQPWKEWYASMGGIANDAALTVLPVFLAGNISGGGENKSGSGGGSKGRSIGHEKGGNSGSSSH